MNFYQLSRHIEQEVNEGIWQGIKSMVGDTVSTMKQGYQAGQNQMQAAMNKRHGTNKPMPYPDAGGQGGAQQGGFFGGAQQPQQPAGGQLPPEKQQQIQALQQKLGELQQMIQSLSS